MIQLKDGVHFTFDRKIVADARRTVGDINIVSHAHADHMPQKKATVVSSEPTAHIASERTGKAVDVNQSYEGIELLPAGHIIGSRAALIDRDSTYLYTGDIATRDRCYIDGFEPVHADVLVLETTYGISPYTFPEQETVERRIKQWISNNNDTTLFLFGYSLGKAQKIQYLAQEATDRPIYAHGSIITMNNAVSSISDLTFRAKPYTENKEALAGSIVLLPSRLSQRDWVDDLVTSYNGLKAGFSGWAVNDSFKYKGGYDTTFVLSDHCDFTELDHLVEAVDPSTVYTHHGFAEAFASHIRKTKSIDARPLKRNQKTLRQFYS